MCKISFLLPNLVAFSCYTVKIHLVKWLIRCDTKRANWWDVYKTHISIFCIKHMSSIFRTLQVNKWQSNHQTLFSSCKINATKFGTKNEISHKIIYHNMTSYGYIIMIIVDSCIIWFHLDCIMQLKKSYYIATNVSSRKSATTFGDLLDCWTGEIASGLNTTECKHCTLRAFYTGFRLMLPFPFSPLMYLTSCDIVCQWEA